MDLRQTYDAMLELQDKLRFEIQSTTSLQEVDYRAFKALGAALELQEYLANAIAAAIASGELDPDPDD